MGSDGGWVCVFFHVYHFQKLCQCSGSTAGFSFPSSDLIKHHLEQRSATFLCSTDRRSTKFPPRTGQKQMIPRSGKKKKIKTLKWKLTITLNATRQEVRFCRVRTTWWMELLLSLIFFSQFYKDRNNPVIFFVMARYWSETQRLGTSVL